MQNVLMKKMQEEEKANKEAIQQEQTRQQQALLEAEQVQAQIEIAEQLPGELEDPAAEVARLKAELEREKREKQELASQLSQQQLHEGGQYEPPSERFKQTVPKQQLSQRRENS